MTGKAARVQSLANCNTLVAYLREHGDSGTSKIKEETELTNLSVTHLWNFNQILIDERRSFRLSTRTVGKKRELQWSIREKKCTNVQK
jgi:hypothetical protein